MEINQDLFEKCRFLYYSPGENVKFPYSYRQKCKNSPFLQAKCKIALLSREKCKT